MGWILIALAILGLVIFLTPVAVVGFMLYTLAVTAGIYFEKAAEVLLPDGRSVERPVATEDRDPVYRPYLIAQVWRDLLVVVRAVGPEIWAKGRKDLAKANDNLLGEGVIFLFPIWLAVYAGAALAVVPVAVVAATIVAAYALTVLAGLSVWAAGMGVLRGVDLLFSLVNRILLVCPNSECGYSRIALPHYQCPTCKERHRRLVPDLNGAVWHACACGTSLPTSIVLGRYRLTSFCPHCAWPLPSRAGRVRVEPLPLVGGPDAGKTTFMALAVHALHAAVEARGGQALFAHKQDEQTFERLRRELAEGRVAKTGTELPKAVAMDVVLDGKSRILYLFDPSGEHFTGATRVESLSYMEHGEAMILVVDPFALPAVQEALLPQERVALSRAGVVLSKEEPATAFERVRNELAGRTDAGVQRRVAVVVTKADLLKTTAIGRGADDLSRWLSETAGQGNLLRTVTGQARTVRYFASGLPADDHRLASLMGWLAGLELSSQATGAARGGTPEAGSLAPPVAVRKRAKELLPLGYMVSRRGTFGVSVALSAAVMIWIAVGVVRVFTG